MNYRILWDNNIILDLFLLRTDLNPHIREIEDITAKKHIPIYISSSQLHNIKFVMKSHFKKAGINKDPNQIISKFIQTHEVKILKTPSYVNLELWAKSEDLEDELIMASANLFNMHVLTRDNDLIRKMGDRAIHPKDYKHFICSFNKSKISMLDLTSQTLYMYGKLEQNIDNIISRSNFILGDEVKQLEEKIAQYTGTRHAIGVASGTDALLLSLRAFAIKKKGKEYWNKEDLVITTPFTFTATGDTILRSGATPLFVDIAPETYNIDPLKIKQALKVYGSRVVGIVPVHLYGLACYMDEIMEIAKEYGLFVVEDCAQAFGARYKEKKVGSFGDTGCFSFFPSKNLGAFGDAGAITTDDDELAPIIKMLRVHGGKDKYNVDHIGYKARLDTIQAAIILAKLKYIDDFNERRRKIAEIYNRELANIDGLILPITYDPSPMTDIYHVYHQYTIRVANGKRDALQRHLKENGIDSMVYYPVPLHKMKVFINNGMEIFGGLEKSEVAAKSVLSLPIEPLMEKREIKKVCELLQAV